MAILAFSLVAGFTVTGRTECTEYISTFAKVQSKYPFFTYDQTATVSDVPNATFTSSGVRFSQRIISGQFFVAWGVLTMFYCITALVVYMLFTANENLERVVDMLIYIVRSVLCEKTSLVAFLRKSPDHTIVLALCICMYMYM